MLATLTLLLVAQADTSAFDRAMEALAQDPPIAAVQEAALKYFAVSANEVGDYRTAARLRALLPAISSSVSFDDQKEASLQVEGQTNISSTIDLSGLGRAFGASATWDLSSLVFNSSELDAYSLVGIHEDVVKEVTRLYYSRQHNILAMLLDPPTDVRAKAALILRTREAESLLDALTGGAFTKLKKEMRGGRS